MALGCGQSPRPPIAAGGTVEVETPKAGWEVIAVDALSPEQLDLRGRCLAATSDLMSETKAELVEALESGGPAEAIGVCSIRAPEIAAVVSNRHGVVLGRTSFRVRNQANAPPDWARAAVAARTEIERWYVGPEGRLGGLLPIRMGAPCLQCHGPVGAIPAEIKTEIVQLYPADQAVGFNEGELRGWVWVEGVPDKTRA